MKAVFYDKSCGAFYISERTIPISVQQRGAIEKMISVSDVLEIVSAAFIDGGIAGYHGHTDSDLPYYMEDVKAKLGRMK